KIKFSLPQPLTAIKHVADTLRKGTDLGQRCVRHLVNNHPVVLSGIVYLRKISGIYLLIRSPDKLSLANSVIVCYVANAVRFQEMVHFPRVLAPDEFSIDPVALSSLVTGSQRIVRTAIE